jgi:large subunit ribosomal protein L1
MAKLTKRAKAANEAVDREKLYGVDEAIKIIKDLAS